MQHKVFDLLINISNVKYKYFKHVIKYKSKCVNQLHSTSHKHMEQHNKNRERGEVDQIFTIAMCGWNNRETSRDSSVKKGRNSGI